MHFLNKTIPTVVTMILFICFSCTDNKSSYSNKQLKIDIPSVSEVSDVDKDTCYSNISELISLSLPKDIWGVDKNPVFVNNRIYIMDSQKHYVLVFDNKGKFLFKVGGIGHSREEIFGQITSFDVDITNNFIHVCNFEGAKILVFDNDGAFVKSIKLQDCVPCSIKILNNGNYLVSNDGMSAEEGTNQLVILDGNGKIYRTIINDEIPNNISANDWGIRTLYSDKKNICYLSSMSDSVIVMNSDTIKEIIKLSFNDDFPKENEILKVKKDGIISNITATINRVSKAWINDFYVIIEFHAKPKGSYYATNFTYLYNRKSSKGILKRGYFNMPNTLGDLVDIDGDNLVMLITEEDYSYVKDLVDMLSSTNYNIRDEIRKTYGPIAVDIWEEKIKLPLIIKMKIK